MTTIVVLGGYGNFGSKIVERLSKESDFNIIVAGRSLEQANKFIETLNRKNVTAQLIDINQTDLSSALKNTCAQIVIHTCGPFQAQHYQVATACMEAGVHYIDLADGRDFVNQFSVLDNIAKQHNVMAITGASSVPGLSSAVINHFLPSFKSLTHVDYGIAPGNRAQRGQATVAAILSYTGKTFLRLENKINTPVYGWQDVHAHHFAKPIGKRWLANCDIPDLDLFPKIYPQLKTIQFYAGLELKTLHFSMWVMSWLSRLTFIDNWARYAKPITKLSEYFEGFGTDVGGMYMHMKGVDAYNQPKAITWTLVAEKGHGPYIPTIASIIIAKKIARGLLNQTGATTSAGLFTLEEFFEEVADWAIWQTTT